VVPHGLVYCQTLAISLKQIGNIPTATAADHKRQHPFCMGFDLAEMVVKKGTKRPAPEDGGEAGPADSSVLPGLEVRYVSS
jgi:hypothetical protein